MQEEFNFWFWKRRELFLVTICYLYFTLKQLIIREEGSPNMLMLRVGWLFSKSAKSAKCFHDTVQCFILISSERQYCLLRGCMHQWFRKCSSPTENWTPPRKQFRTGSRLSSHMSQGITAIKANSRSGYSCKYYRVSQISKCIWWK